MARKIDAMHERFGRRGWGKCGECEHFKRGLYHNRILQKCEVYGMTHSEATDWAQRYDACGLYNAPYSGPRIIDLMKYEPRRADTESIEGQITLEEIVT